MYKKFKLSKYMANKTVLISGGTSGLGKADALQLLDEGYNVAVFTVDPKQKQEFEEEVGGRYDGKKYLACLADITKEGDLKKTVSEVVKKFGALDILINNAGVGYFEAADKVDISRYHQMMDINMIGMAALVKLAVPQMKKQKSGLIVNISSVAGVANFPGRSSLAKGEFYSSTKYAVMGYSEGLRAELADHGIKVTTICPGLVNTHFFSDQEYQRRMKENWHGKQPAVLEPSDISRVISFICSQPPHCEIHDIVVVPFRKK